MLVACLQATAGVIRRLTIALHLRTRAKGQSSLFRRRDIRLPTMSIRTGGRFFNGHAVFAPRPCGRALSRYC